jgi:glycosyltransferase involved in cell wall biosynthesis
MPPTTNALKKMRILFQNRANAFEMPGGDTVVMQRLREQLELHGATVDFSPQPLPGNIRSYDLIHLFNLTVPQCTERFAKNAVRNNIPFVVTSLQENFPHYYHKAKATVAWFGDYIAARAAGRQPDMELSRVIEQASPITMVTSPFAVQAADKIFTCGATESDLLRSLFPDARVTAVHFGSSIKQIDAPASLFEQTFNVKDFVLVVGRLETRKNQLMLLYALESSEIPIVFADGGFTYQPDYTQLCRRYTRKGPVLFTGRLKDELLVSAYHACRIHCLPSWYELPGLVSIEAARYGCPIVASSWGCLPDYLMDVCTWCSPEDPSSIRDAVVSAYENGKRGIGEAIAGKFTWEEFGSETIRHYEQVLQEHKRYAPELVALADQDKEQLTVATFINRITQMLEQNNVVEALAYYDKHRSSFTYTANGLLQADALMLRLRRMLQHT